VGRSFLSRVSPSRSRTKVIDWPFPVEGETPKIRLSVLGADKLEAATLEAVDHFAALRKKKGIEKVGQQDVAFIARERIALVWHAVQAQSDDGKWEPLAASVDDLAAEPSEVLTELYQEWSQLQADVTVRPMTGAQMTAYIAELKKNSQGVPLSGFPSSWLIELVRTLASQHANSTTASEPG
jgi:hypothetical protein